MVTTKLCHFRDNAPFALHRTGQLIDPRCELPEYYDPPEMLEDVEEDNIHEEDTMSFNTFSNGLMEVSRLPEEWLVGVSKEDKEKFNREIETVDEKKKEEVPFDEHDILPPWK
jgi:hypothetical protein